jgi:sugar/nucleoside kinase (ribokinase family)
MAEDAEVAQLGEREFDLIGEITSASGGGASNAAIGVRRLTWYDESRLSCHLVAKIGANNGTADEDGTILLKYLQGMGIETDLIQYDESNPTGRSLILSIEYDGERDVVYLVCRKAAKLKQEDLPELDDAVVGGMVTNCGDPVDTLGAVRWLAQGERPVVHIASKAGTKKMRELLLSGQTELFVGLESVLLTANKKEFDKLESLAVKESVVGYFAQAVISDGTSGVNVYQYGPDVASMYPADHYDIAPDRPVEEVPKCQINPNGAGDSMSACLATYWVEKMRIDPQDMQVALSVAACVCTQPSTTGGVPYFLSIGDVQGFVDCWVDHNTLFEWDRWLKQ